MVQELTVREIKESDIDLIIQYWMNAGNDHLVAMGVDLAKLPSETDWQRMLASQILLPNPEKQSYCTIWELNGKPIGHCNVNKIIFGEEASMHLHIWYAEERKMGLGVAFIKKSLPFFFNQLHLKKVYSEPYALNEAPNRTLAKAGFHFIKEYTTVPGSINFEQPVKRWEIKAADL
jgi:RimJ/RimL family protein N-acetyltransferase